MTNLRWIGARVLNLAEMFGQESKEYQEASYQISKKIWDNMIERKYHRDLRLFEEIREALEKGDEYLANQYKIERKKNAEEIEALENFANCADICLINNEQHRKNFV